MCGPPKDETPIPEYRQPSKHDIDVYATLDSLRHDEALLSVARKILAGEHTITVAPVIRPHSIDLITFEKGLIRFIEIKSLHAGLSPLEAKVKQLVESQPPLKYEVIRYE
jgi:hypothetical protein